MYQKSYENRILIMPHKAVLILYRMNYLSDVAKGKNVPFNLSNLTVRNAIALNKYSHFSTVF